MKSLPLLLIAVLLPLITITGCKTAPESKEAPSSSLTLVPPPPTVPDSLGFVTTGSGLKYKVLASGPAGGRSPTRSDSVSVHYRGTLRNGTVFDSSYDRGQPATFGVGQVIPGWTEALQLMKPGDKWLLHIPSRLAYGGRAVGAKIPPYSDLIFEVHLLQITSGF